MGVTASPKERSETVRPVQESTPAVVVMRETGTGSMSSFCGLKCTDTREREDEDWKRVERDSFDSAVNVGMERWTRVMVSEEEASRAAEDD